MNKVAAARGPRCAGHCLRRHDPDPAARGYRHSCGRRHRRHRRGHRREHGVPCGRLRGSRPARRVSLRSVAGKPPIGPSRTVSRPDSSVGKRLAAVGGSIPSRIAVGTASKARQPRCKMRDGRAGAVSGAVLTSEMGLFRKKDLFGRARGCE